MGPDVRGGRFRADFLFSFLCLFFCSDLCQTLFDFTSVVASSKSHLCKQDSLRHRSTVARKHSSSASLSAFSIRRAALLFWLFSDFRSGLLACYTQRGAYSR